MNSAKGRLVGSGIYAAGLGITLTTLTRWACFALNFSSESACDAPLAFDALWLLIAFSASDLS
jgi:hypothetical protein